MSEFDGLRKRKRKLRKTKIKQKGDYAYISFNWRRNVARIILFFTLISSGFFTAFIVLSIASKNTNIRLHTDLNVDEFEKISLITYRAGENPELPLNLSSKSSVFNIPKSSELKEFLIEKEIVIINEPPIKTYTSNYTYNETLQVNQSVSNVESVNGTIFNSYNNITSESSEHYEGVFTFTNDLICGEPDGIYVDYGFVYIEQEWENHKMVLSMEDSSKINIPISTKQNGTIEFWVLPDQYNNFQLELGDGSDLIKLRTYCNRLYYYNGFWWSESGKLDDNHISDSEWTNIRIDFRCDNAPIYLGLSQGKFDVYLNNIKIYENKDFLSYSEDITDFEIRSLGSSGRVFLDSISITGELKEITNETYNIGDKDNQFDLNKKDYYFDFNLINANYKHLKNLTVDLEFLTSLILNSENTGLMVYNFFDSQWEYLKFFNDNRTFSKLITNIEYLNKSSTEDTMIHFKIATSKLYLDYNVSMNISCFGYFWREITEFYYEESTSFEGELIINIETTTIYKEREIQLITLIDINQYFCFGSWVFSNMTTINHTIVIREETYHIPIDHEINLNELDSFFGWRILDIEIMEIDLAGQSITTEYAWEEFSI